MNYYNESKTYESETKKYDKNMQTGMDGCSGNNVGMMEMPGCGCAIMPVYECPQERVCHRYICYDVPQDCQFMLYTKYGMNLHT